MSAISNALNYQKRRCSEVKILKWSLFT